MPILARRARSLYCAASSLVSTVDVLEAAQTAQCAEFIVGRRFAPTRWLIAPTALLEGWMVHSKESVDH
jgi:hypothetical protein